MKNIIAIACLLPMAALAANPQTGCAELVANQSQPHITINAADRCTTNLLAGQLTINFASNANLTLSTAQWQYGTIVLTDTGPVLSAGRDIVYPNTDAYTGGTSRATFYLKNSTAQTLTVKRSGQTGVAVLAGGSALLHHNGTDVEAVSAGGSGAPSSATYITQTANGSLSNEQALGALSTGLVKNTTTTGVLSIGASTDVIGMFSGTCTSSSSRYLATDGSCQLLSAGGDASTNTASSVDSEITLFSGTGGKTLKRATTTGILKGASGVLSAATAGTDYYAPGGTDVAFADGGTGLSAASDDQTIVSSGSAWVAKTLPDCTDTGGNHINYTQSTNAFSCGTSSSGGGGTPGGSTTQVQYNNAGAFGGDADFTWTAASNLMTLGSLATPTIVTGATATASSNGGAITLRGGPGGSTTGVGGVVTVQGGAAVDTASNGGNVFITGGAGGGASGVGGNVQITTGGGSSSGEFIVQSALGATLMKLKSDGALGFGASFGTTGQVLTSNGGFAAPAWTDIGGPTTGGTGQTTVTQGDLLYGSAADTWSKLAKSASATRYLANTGTSNNPAWAQVALATGVSGTLPQANRLRTVRTITAAGAVTGASTDEIICINKTSGAATTVNLHGSPATGFEYTIKDCKGDALTNNITVTPAAGNIDGAGTYVININYASVTIFYNGTAWFSE